MHLNIFTVLLFALHAEGHVLKCYQCTDLLGPCVKEEMMCSTQEALCSSQTTVQSIGNASQSTKIKSCTEPKMCVNGSVNFGITRTATTTQCCFADLCNSRDVSDSNSNNLNGKQCYFCNKKSCVNKVNCAGSEDHCIKAKVNTGSISMTVKGCASKSVCDVPSQISQVYSDISCCQGNLCNSAKSITQNLLILLSWPFISYIMFH